MSQEQSKQMDDGGGLAANETISTTIPTTMHDPSAPPRLPEELMLMIYDFCPRSTLTKCLVLDHRQFDLVVNIIWRTVDSRKVELRRLTRLMDKPLKPAGLHRLSKYLSAVHTYHAPDYRFLRFANDIPSELRAIAKKCPNIQRLDVEGKASVTFWRGHAESWTEMEMEIGNVPSFMEGMALREWGPPEEYDSPVFAVESPTFVLTRLAIEGREIFDIAGYRHVDPSLIPFMNWILPHIGSLRTLEIGPWFGESEYAEMFLQLCAPTVEKLRFYGYVSDELIVKYVSALPGLRDFGFRPHLKNPNRERLGRDLKKTLSDLDLEKITYFMAPPCSNHFMIPPPGSLGDFMIPRGDPHDAVDYRVFDDVVGSTACHTSFVHARNTLFCRDYKPIREWERKWIMDMVNLARNIEQAEQGS